MTESAPGNHGHLDAGRDRERGRDQARFVADAASGMLVDLRARDRAEVDLLSRGDEALGHCSALPVAHALEVHGHEKGRHLIVRDLARSVAVYQPGNLFGGQFLPVALPLDEVYCTPSQYVM